MAEEILESQGTADIQEQPQEQEIVQQEDIVEQPEQQDQQVPEPPKKMSVKDFASKIKAKYPDYANVDDNQLVTKMLEKYPVYKDQVELSQKPELPQQPKQQAPIQKQPWQADFEKTINSGLFNTRADATRVAKPITEETTKQVEQSRVNKNIAIEGTIERRLKNKGIKTAKNSPLYQSERKKVEQAIEDGDAVISKNPITGEPVLSQTTGFWESTWNSAKDAVQNEEEAADFINMTTPQRVEYANRKAKEVKTSPEGYVGEVAKAESFLGIPIPEDLGYVMGSTGQMAGGVAPFMGKATLGGLTGAALVAAAPVTGGASLVGIPALMAATAGTAGAFAATVGDMVNQGGRDEVIRRYWLLKERNPQLPDEEAMKEAEKGLTSGEIVGGITNMAFMIGGGKPLAEIGKKAISQEGKQTATKYVANAIKGGIKKAKGVVPKIPKTYVGEAIGAGVKMGGIISATEAAKEVEAGIEDERLKLSGSEIASNSAKAFFDNATVGTIIHGLSTMPLPAAVKSAYKFILSKENPQEVAQVIKANEAIGNVPEGTTEKVMADVFEFNDALGKTSEGLTPDTQVSVAGLIQKRDRLMTEMASKDPTQVEAYKQQIDALNNQITKITESNDPFEHEVNIVGEKLSEVEKETEPQLPQVKEGEKVYRVEYTNPETGQKTSKLFANAEEGKKFQDFISNPQNEWNAPRDTNAYYEKYDGTSKLEVYDTENITGVPSKVGIGEELVQAQPIQGGGTQEISGGGILQENVPSGEGKVAEVTEAQVAGVEPKAVEDLLGKKAGEEVKAELPEIKKVKDIIKQVKGRVGTLSGDANAETRRFIVETLTGEKTSKNNAGVNRLMQVVEDYIGLKPDSQAGKYDQINKWANEPIREEVSGAVQPMSEVPQEQKVETGVQPSAERVSEGKPKAAAPVLAKEGELPLNKDTKAPFETKSKKQIVKRQKEGGLVEVTSKEGKKVSRTTEKKALREYANAFDFSVGKTAEEIAAEKDLLFSGVEDIIDASENPLELSEIYVNEEPTTQSVSAIETMIGEYGVENIKPESFKRYNDKNNITQTLAKRYLGRRKSLDYDNRQGLDVLAKEMSDHYFPEGDGTEISPEDIGNFMVRFPDGKWDKLAESENATSAADRFQKLTGLILNREIADISIKNEFEKATNEERKLFENEYKTQSELEADYWDTFAKTDGFTKEIPDSEIEQKGKEAEGAKPVTKPVEPVKPRAEGLPEKEEAKAERKRARKEPGKYESGAIKFAEKIKAVELLPDFMKAEGIEGVKKSGISEKELKELLADAVITMGKLMDKGVEFSQALKAAVKDIVKTLGEERRESIEKGFESYYRENVGAKAEEVKGAEPPKPPIPEKETSPEYNEDMTKMANAINDAYVEGKFGVKALDAVLAKLQETDIKEIYEKVKEEVAGGKINIKETREKIITTKNGSEKDQAILLYDLAELKGKEDQIQKAIIESTDANEKLKLQKDLIDVQNQMMDNALANRMLGRTASTIFRIRQAWVNRDADLAQMEQQYKASKGVKNLTNEQQKIVKSAYDKIRELKAKVNKAKQELTKALELQEKSKKENEVLAEIKKQANEIKKKERSQKVSEKIEASRKRIEEARERLRKIRNNMNDVTRVVPETAYEIGKIAAEKVYQGALKFDELVKSVYEDVKDIFPEWTEKDVRQHLLPDVDVESYYEGREDIPKSAEDVKTKLNAYQKLQSEYAKKIFEWQKDRATDLMEQMPLRTRIIDKILRWQRFAVLSYPSTMVKLGAVVAHQLALKPLKFATQYLQGKALESVSPKLAKEQQIFGTPSIKALSKYYSEFVRNFSAANLKEQFSGIDAKEILYGKNFMYDEWAAGKGLLEIPGRAHGYIKSFIKNPEFQFAHEQLVSWHMNKMDEISKKLEDKNLTAEEKSKLEEEYLQNDVTNEEVLGKINSQALNHAKWSIMMNDNKFVDKFRNFADKNDIAGALIRSELPIVKIPVNFVSRVFAYKYGLIQAIIGKVGDRGRFPGAIDIIKKGTENLTNEQADFIGKTLTLGSIGASFFALGYYNRDKIKENEDGSYEIFGTHVSKNLIHSPEIETLLNGANMGNRMKGDDGFIQSMMESEWDIIKKSPFVSMLTFGFLPNVAAALMSKQNEDKKADKISYATAKKITDMAVPGFVKQLAQWTDVEGGGVQPMGEPIKRKPQGTNLEKAFQTFELSVPRLRQRVPVSEMQPTSSQISKLKDYGVEPPKFGTRSQYKIEVDKNHKKEGTTKDGKDYSYMTENEFIKFNNYKKEYLNKGLDIAYKLNLDKEELNKAVEKINRQATLIAKQKLINEGLISEPQEKEDEYMEINEALKELYESEKPY